MSSWARVGAKCVCVDNPQKRLEKGVIYVISDTRIDSCGEHNIRIEGRPDWWITSYFRPLVPAKTQADDIALIKSLLTPAPELVE